MNKGHKGQMSDRDVMKLALEALENWMRIDTVEDMHIFEMVTAPEAITALRQALAQHKYRRGDRLLCLESEEYCVIHISGTDRQWVKFPDSYIAVYTNEQVQELFELLPKETDEALAQPANKSDCGHTEYKPFCQMCMTTKQKPWDTTDMAHRAGGLSMEQEPVAWVPIEEMYPQAKAIDILMGDGSILCAVLPQLDGDLWWGGSGTGEKFIDPKYANVTHWRIHSDTAPPKREWVGLTDGEIFDVIRSLCADNETAEMLIHVSMDEYRAIEAKLKEKNT